MRETGGIPVARMNDHFEIPCLGYGVYLIPPGETRAAVSEALKAGYRLIDTAQGYGNEEGVGEAVAASGIPRSEIFITTKLTSRAHGRVPARRALEESLRRLGTEQIDLFLIHWPIPRLGLYLETWEAFIDLRAEGKVRSIGVSNFTERLLQRIIDETGVAPAVNQVELHPFFAQRPLREFDAAHSIVTEAWGPLGQGSGLLGHPAVREVAAAAGRTPAQVVLRWHIQLGNVAIPKSVRPDRMRENLGVFDFKLDAAAMGRLSALETGSRLGPDPEEFDIPAG